MSRRPCQLHDRQRGRGQRVLRQPLAAEEFPQYDVNLRSAVSIARRLQDPLAELVKIDPKAIGVGQYQHDMPQKRLAGALDGVVETASMRWGWISTPPPPPCCPTWRG